MSLIEWSGLADRMNADPELTLHARLWTADLRLDFGDLESRRLRFEDGKVAAIESCDGDTCSDVFVSATEEQWIAMLADTPQPFFQDLLGANLHHGVKLNENFEDFAAYYPALRRLLEILRANRADER